MEKKDVNTEEKKIQHRVQLIQGGQIRLGINLYTRIVATSFSQSLLRAPVIRATSVSIRPSD